jgi:hypothetical protein
MTFFTPSKHQQNHTSTTSSLFAAMVIASSLISGTAIAEESASDSAAYSGGLVLGSMGAGISFGAKTNWSLTNNDQIQWRVQAAGIDTDFDKDDDIELAGIDYNDGNLELFSLQAGVDWYPYASGWADEVFFSTGLIFTDGDFEAKADNSKSYSVGNTTVSPGDITSLTTEIDHRGVLPYISLGWGNKITGERGFDFHAELGLALPTGDADVKVSAVDPGSFLAASDLRAEEKDIEDELNGFNAFGMIAVSYHY